MQWPARLTRSDSHLFELAVVAVICRLEPYRDGFGQRGGGRQRENQELKGFSSVHGFKFFRHGAVLGTWSFRAGADLAFKAASGCRVIGIAPLASSKGGHSLLPVPRIVSLGGKLAWWTRDFCFDAVVVFLLEGDTYTVYLSEGTTTLSMADVSGP